MRWERSNSTQSNHRNNKKGRENDPEEPCCRSDLLLMGNSEKEITTKTAVHQQEKIIPRTEGESPANTQVNKHLYLEEWYKTSEHWRKANDLPQPGGTGL